MKMLMLNVFPRTLLQEKLTLETKIYSTSLKECFVSKIYSTYKFVNRNTGYSNHCDEQCDVDHGNNQVRPTVNLGKYMSFLRSPQTRAERKNPTTIVTPVVIPLGPKMCLEMPA